MSLADRNRITWDEYFMEIAFVASKRATCNKILVGAVVAKNNRILGTGYNGAPAKMPHCTDNDTCHQHNEHCVSVVHAEVNAILQALKGGDVEGAKIYCTHRPCIECCKVIINSGISEVYYSKLYYDNRCKYLNVSDQSQYLAMAGVVSYHLIPRESEEFHVAFADDAYSHHMFADRLKKDSSGDTV